MALCLWLRNSADLFCHATSISSNPSPWRYTQSSLFAYDLMPRRHIAIQVLIGNASCIYSCQPSYNSTKGLKTLTTRCGKNQTRGKRKTRCSGAQPRCSEKYQQAGYSNPRPLAAVKTTLAVVSTYCLKEANMQNSKLISLFTGSSLLPTAKYILAMVSTPCFNHIGNSTQVSSSLFNIRAYTL